MPIDITTSTVRRLRKSKRRLKQPANIPEWKPPLQWEKDYMIYLTRNVNLWRDSCIQKVIPFLDDLVLSSQVVRPPEASNIKSDSSGRVDGWVDQLERIMMEYEITLKELPTGPDWNFNASQVGKGVDEWNKDQWYKISDSVLSVPLVQANPWLSDTIQSFAKENVSLISKLQGNTVRDIEEVINRGIRQGKTAKTIEQELLDGTDLQKGVFHKTETRARLIARDQVDKLNGQLTNLRQTEAGITQYRWRTAMDERVRKKHKSMSGKLCQWGNSTVYKNTPFPKEEWKLRSSIGGISLHPGQDYQCRCYAEPDFSTIVESLEDI